MILAQHTGNTRMVEEVKIWSRYRHLKKDLAHQGVERRYEACCELRDAPRKGGICEDCGQSPVPVYPYQGILYLGEAPSELAFQAGKRQVVDGVSFIIEEEMQVSSGRFWIPSMPDHAARIAVESVGKVYVGHRDTIDRVLRPRQ